MNMKNYFTSTNSASLSLGVVVRVVISDLYREAGF